MCLIIKHIQNFSFLSSVISEIQVWSQDATKHSNAVSGEGVG